MLDVGHSFIFGTVIQYWNDATYAPIYMVYYADLAAMCMAFVGTAYVVYHTVVAAISTTNGFYFNYADWSAFSNRMFAYEVLVIAAWDMWALITTLLALYSGAALWDAADARLAEAKAGSIGVETPLTVEKGIKAAVLCMVAGVSTLISAYALGESADELVAYFDDYSDDTNKEGDDKTDSSNKDPAGTAAQNDIGLHLITTLYGYFVLGAIATGGFIFANQFLGFDDTFECDLQEGVISRATYEAAFPILAAQTDRASCLETIQQVFDIEDLNNDGFVTRCEDATLQRALGATPEYAYKFSSAFTRASFNKICAENFPY